MKNGFGSVNAVTIVVSDAMSLFTLKILYHRKVVGLTAGGRSGKHYGLLLYI